MTTSPGSTRVLATRSITCWPPVVTTTSSGSARMSSAPITSAMQVLVSASPSVGPYWSAFAHDSAAIRCATAAKVSGGKVLVSGRPPASEMISGRAVTAIRSRMADDFMTFVREAKSPAQRSRSREMLTAPAVGYRPRMSVFMDTTTGMGLSGATGVRPYLPPLLAGALARGDTGIDFDGTDWHFLESTGFLLAV